MMAYPQKVTKYLNNSHVWHHANSLAHSHEERVTQQRLSQYCKLCVEDWKYLHIKICVNLSCFCCFALQRTTWEHLWRMQLLQFQHTSMILRDRLVIVSS